MKLQKQVSILGIAALGIFILTGCTETRDQTSAERERPATQGYETESADPGTRMHERGQVQGELTKVDTNAKTLAVKSTDGREMEFRYNDQTQIMGAERNVEGLATKSGAPVTVHYDEGSMTATRIEVSQRY